MTAADNASLHPRGPAPRGRTFNRAAIFGVIITVALVAAGTMWVAFSSRQLPIAAAPTPVAAQGAPAAIQSLPKDYVFPEPAAASNPAPTTPAATQDLEAEREKHQRELQKIQEADLAARSAVLFPRQSPNSGPARGQPSGIPATQPISASGLNALPGDAASTIPALLANLPGGSSANPTGGLTFRTDNTDPTIGPDARAAAEPSPFQKLRFPQITGDAAANAYLPNAIEQPRSRYELKAGTIIPAALVTAVNTDLPGDVVARVTENVYDTRTGRYLLVPQASVLYGRENSSVPFGQERIQIVWTRLILPNGNSITLAPANATDAIGAPGIYDQVDNHYDKLATGIALSSLIALGGNLAQSSTPINGTQISLTNTVAQTVAQEASRVGNNVVDRDLNVQPTLTARPGARIDALVNKDMILEPYMADR